MNATQNRVKKFSFMLCFQGKYQFKIPKKNISHNPITNMQQIKCLT